MNIDNFKTICVVGFGKSGIALCNLLLSLKKKVIVSDISKSSEFESSVISQLKNQGVDFEFEAHTADFIKKSQLIITSPGVDIFSSSLKDIAAGLMIPCVGEIEFSFWLTKASIVAITGTNGKTTTSQLAYELLKKKKKRIFLGGNIGTPFSSFVLKTRPHDIVVLEISSFQLETIIEFRPFIAALLNLEPDHMDRYKDFESYCKAKMNLFRNQGPQDWAILNKNIHFSRTCLDSIRSKTLFFSNEFDNENFSSVYRIAGIFGFSKADCLAFFSTFKGFPHRLEFVADLKGVTYINDSKATNPASTIWALKNIKTPVILLAGGKDKGLDYSAITPYLSRVRRINLFGESAGKINRALEPFEVKTDVFATLKEAVIAAHSQSKKGDTVLLSPMCSSFDEFKDYQDRGRTFIDIVKSL
ncbi:MAG: UDP-N-acetylmuramoyl-L-alanine--D-glutamate ligase [Candidatus Omnitrophica bacterium]|nr:UDP-N-acetylmuramoyl-L-alanine--D-glutamate ligase [Candidatus Omnitrophota bacterium]